MKRRRRHASDAAVAERLTGSRPDRPELRASVAPWDGRADTRLAGRTIVAVNRYYKPDTSATGQLLADLAEHLAARGAQVTVLTSRLAYEGPVPDHPPREMLGGVSVRRLRTTRFGRHSMLGRAIDYLSFCTATLLALAVTLKRGDIVIAKTDPPLLSVAVAPAVRLRGAKLVNWCQDIFPEAASALGVRLVRGSIAGIAIRLRNGALNSAQFNVVLGESMARRLEGQGVARSALRIVPNWADPDIRPVERTGNPLRTAWGLTRDDTVIGYSGNLGRAHLSDVVTGLVRDTAAIRNLRWLFVGTSPRVDRLREACPDAGDRVLFRARQARSDLSLSLSVPDLHLVSLDPICEGLMVPSKFYGALAAGRPVLFLGDPDGEMADLVEAERIGAVLDARNPAAAIETLSSCVNNGLQLAVWGANARALYERRFSAGRALDAWTRALVGMS